MDKYEFVNTCMENLRKNLRTGKIADGLGKPAESLLTYSEEGGFCNE